MKKMRSDLTLKGSDIFLIGSAIGYGLKIQSNEDSDPHLFFALFAATHLTHCIYYPHNILHFGQGDWFFLAMLILLHIPLLFLKVEQKV